MTGAIVVVGLAALGVATIFAAVLLAHRPEEGWTAWVRDAVRAWRRDELRLADRVDEEDAGGLGTLYLMSEPGHAYTTPEELGGPVVSRLRGHVQRGGGHPTSA